MTGRPPWNIPLASLLAELGGATRGGLTSEEAKRRLAEYGANDALTRRRRPLWRQILDRFANPLILILLFAASLSAWTGQVTSFVIITVIILLSVVLDVVQQLRAENAVEALRRSVGLRCLVIRDGQECTIPVEQIVPGDVVRLAAGDIVPADCRLLAARDLFVNQALLTGEPYPVEKRASDLPSPAGEVSEAGNFLFMGTSAISGTATAVVCRTGRQDGARGACRRARLAATAGRIRTRHPAGSGCSCCGSPSFSSCSCWPPTCCSTAPGWTRCCSRWRSPSALRPSCCPWWSR